jgi:hypothetical protein
MRRMEVLRRIYNKLIDLHPRRFRERFGEQMLSIFDEAANRRSGARLLVDGLVSAIRQWVMPPSLAEKVRRLNLFWAIAGIPLQIAVATVVRPETKTVAAQLFHLLSPGGIFVVFYFMLNRAPQQFISIRAAGGDSRRDGFQIWSEFMGRFLIGALLILSAIALVGSSLGPAPNGSGWLWVDLTVLAIQSATFFTILRPLNRRAAAAIRG